MLVRQVVVPASPEQLWDALTEPLALAAWFGSQVEWDLRPGGRARFVGDDGTRRGGVIDAVLPGRHLRFRWWPEGASGSEGQAGASQVSYDLEPDDEGTRLTITERQVPASPDTAPDSAPDAALDAFPVRDTAARACSAADPGCWTEWDSRMVRCWAQVASLSPVGMAVRAPAAGAVAIALR